MSARLVLVFCLATSLFTAFADEEQLLVQIKSSTDDDYYKHAIVFFHMGVGEERGAAGSKGLLEPLKAVAQKLKGIVTVASVDCSIEDLKKICRGIMVPSIKLFYGEKKKNPYTKQFYRESIDYKGPQTAKGLLNAASEMLSNEHITKIHDADSFEHFALKNPERLKVRGVKTSA